MQADERSRQHLTRLIAQSHERLERSRDLSRLAAETLRLSARADDRHQLRALERQVLRELVETHYRRDAGRGEP